MEFFNDDKTLVVVCATVIAIVCIFAMPDQAQNIVGNVVTGLFGVAVGKALNENKGA